MKPGQKYKYIRFEQSEETKTGWYCKNKKSDDILGFVYFYKPWKQYCFYTIDNMVFNISCLQDIADFLGYLNTI